MFCEIFSGWDTIGEREPIACTPAPHAKRGWLLSTEGSYSEVLSLQLQNTASLRKVQRGSTKYFNSYNPEGEHNLFTFGSGPRGRRPGWAATHRRDEAITVCGKAPKAGVYILLRKMDPLHKRKWNFKVTKVYLGHRRIESNHNSQYRIPNIHVEVKTYQWKSSESLWTKMVWRNQM